ncbi:MAG: methyltransferase [Methylococcus sp.]
MSTPSRTDALPPVEADVLALAYDFSGIATLVNLGGVEDSHAVAILQANPGMRGVFIEEPHKAETSRKRLLAGGVLNRCDIIAAEPREALLAEADACLLSAFHRFTDADAAVLLHRCRSGMPARGRILIIEMFVADRAPGTAPENDPPLLASTAAGRFRTLDETEALLREEGFHPTRFVPLDEALGLLEARPEGA